MDARWAEMRELFDAVCELPAEQWTEALQRLTQDPELLQQTLDLLHAQTTVLHRARTPLDGLIASLALPELAPGDSLGPWRLGERMAAGGMGVVYAAERADGLYQRRVAVKLLNGLADTRVRERLAEECRILAGLQHPNIARLYDAGTTAAGAPYLVMEYIEGRPLDRYCREAGLGLAARLQLFVRICRALQAAHSQLVIHCDIKPGNILVREDAEPVLLDFGVSRLAGAGSEDGSPVFCTPAYAAPEVMQGGVPDVRADVFSLGVLLGELLGDGPVLRAPGAPVPLPGQLAPAGCPWRRQLHGDLDAIVARACASEPASRYATAEALGDDVRRYLEHRPVLARRGGRLYRLGRGLRRHWQAASVAAVLVGMAGLFVWHLGQARSRAEAEARMAQQVGDFLLEAFEAADPRKRGKGEVEATAREVLDAGAARIDAELRDAPELRARVQYIIGLAYKNVGASTRAEELLRAAAEGLLAPGMDRRTEAVDALNELATQLANDRRGVEAEEVARRSLALAEELPADVSTLMRARAINSIGLALMEQERHPAALEAFEQSLAMRQGADRQRQGAVMHNIGLLYRRMGRLEQSRQMLEQALLHKAGQSGERSYEFLVTQQVLAVTVAEQGQLLEARALQQKNLALALELFGEDSEHTSGAYNDLAGTSQDLGDYPAAAAYYGRALEIEGRLQGEDSVDYAVTLNNLATLEESRGNVVAALEMYRRSLRIREAALGSAHASTLRASANLGRALLRSGQLAEAEPLLAHALEVWATRLEPDARDMLITRMGWAEWLLRGSRFGEARTALDELAPLLEGKPVGLRYRHQALLAELAQREGRAEDAVGGWRQAIALAEEAFGSDTISTARNRVPLAESLLQAGQVAPAREQLQRAAPVLRENLVPGAELLQRLGHLETRLRG